MLNNLVKKLGKLSAWQLIALFIVLAEVLSALMNAALSRILWGKISLDLIFIGSIDALVVSFIVSKVGIYLIGKHTELTNINERLHEEIEARKQAEEQIKASLKEKEVLLREIHHRVKNNLQMIISLLKLQSQYVEDKKVLELLSDGQDRIQSMALVHQKLYQTKDLTHISFKDYIKDLVEVMRESQEVGTSSVAVHLDIDDIRLEIDTAMYMGLMINELVTNAFKHAFPKGRGGEIRISLKKVGRDGEQTECELTVADNGIGIPADLDVRETKTLGLRLITILAEEQLQGKIELDRTKGTEFRIRFNEGKGA
jgi:two-component sensor histidine kinase